MVTDRDIVQALPSLYPLTETEEKAVIYLTARRPVEFAEEGCEDRAETHPVCPNCKRDLDDEHWDVCPYCGIPSEW